MSILKEAIKSIKIKDNPDGSADIQVEYNPKLLYPLIRDHYGEKRGSKKLVGKFILEVLDYVVKKYEKK